MYLTGIDGLNGGKLARLKNSMNMAIDERMRMHEVIWEGDNCGLWIEPADVIREMIMAAKGIPGVDYNINLMGDGR